MLSVKMYTPFVVINFYTDSIVFLSFWYVIKKDFLLKLLYNSL